MKLKVSSLQRYYKNELLHRHFSNTLPTYSPFHENIPQWLLSTCVKILEKYLRKSSFLRNVEDYSAATLLRLKIKFVTCIFSKNFKEQLYCGKPFCPIPIFVEPIFCRPSACNFTKKWTLSQVFSRLLPTLQEHLFLGTTLNGCFWVFTERYFRTYCNKIYYLGTVQ